MKLRSLLTILTLICISVAVPMLSFAQGNPGVDPDPVPLDGGLSLLIGAGIAYGAKKAYDRKKKATDSSEQKEIS